MNQVDIYIGNYRLDLFQDEEISITLNLQNISDISKLFSDYTQSFTIPASDWNNEVLKQYYRTDVDGSQVTKRNVVDNSSAVMGLLGYVPDTITETTATNSFDFRLRPEARIELNSLPFRTGVVEMESVQLKGTEPYAYTFSFYGSLVNLTDLFGEDYLYDLDLSAFDHTYDGATIQSGIDGSGTMPISGGGTSGTSIIYPCITPVRNWQYAVHGSSADEDDIKYNNAGGHAHGINYYEVKPAVRCREIIAAIEAKYGITFSGFFDDNDEFQKLYMWAHRREGWMYQNQPNAMKYRKIDFDSRTGTYFDLANDTFDIPANFGSQYGTYTFTLVINTLSQDANFSIYVNGGYRTSQVIKTTGTFYFYGLKLQDGDRISLRVKTQDNSTSLTYGLTSWEMIFYPDAPAPPFSFGTARMSGTDSVSITVRVSELMPEQKIADFIKGIIKMHNLVFVPVSNTEFSVVTLDDYYANSINKSWDEYMDITEVTVKRPSIYRRIEFKYQEAGAILGATYLLQNGVGYGDLRADFDFDGEEYIVELPFEQLMWELLTDAETGVLTENILVAKSIDRNLEPYIGAPMLFYATEDFFLDDPGGNTIGFIDEFGHDTELTTIWYCNTSSRYDVNNETTYSTNFGGDIDAYFLQAVSNGLYQTYWFDYITDLYDSQRRLVSVNAQLPTGSIITIALNNKIIWNNQRWIINSADVNMTTGKVSFELLNEV